uniref:Floricaula/leafy-like transcription factor n=1 Tax=Nothoceros aenigmaticus TaxID=13813 RepID=W8EDT4_9EMBR|nr:LFY [Nothoceros aenigmaticus]
MGQKDVAVRHRDALMVHKDNSLGPRESRVLDQGFSSMGRREAKTLDELFRDYGVRPSTLETVAQMGFTVGTMINMTDDELDSLIKTMIENYRVDLLVGEKFGIKSAVRAERRLLDEVDRVRIEMKARTESMMELKGQYKVSDCGTGLGGVAMVSGGNGAAPGGLANVCAPSPKLAATKARKKKDIKDELSHPLLSGNVLAAMSPGALPGLLSELSSDSEGKVDLGKRRAKRKRKVKEPGEEGDDRPREHPFVVTEPGELARGKKNGLDYLFNLYEQAGKFLEEVQHIAREKGEKCPTKVTNQVFRHAKVQGAGYINKPKMRQYVHCYALHCLASDKSDELRRCCKERGENVGAWCQACYLPLIKMAKEKSWDIEGLFNSHDKLKIWYVPKKLIQLCHQEKSK